MKYLVFTNTPAHVHLYKHAIAELQSRGHDVQVLARDYGCTRALLDRFGLPYTIYGRCGTTKWSLLRRLPGHYLRIARQTHRFDPDLIFGMGAYAAHAGAHSRTPVVLLLDSEPTTFDHAISTPFADLLLTPAAFRSDLGENHYVFEGFKESAYLHPDIFTPDPSIREALEVEPDEPYVIVRFNAFGSHHDVGKGGFTPSQRRTLIGRLAEEATVFVSDEGGTLDLSGLPARPFDIHPALLHDALAEAQLLVADTQTIVTEAALLGTPAIRSNSFVGPTDMGNFVELADHGLVDNCTDFDAVLQLATDRLTDGGTRERWRKRRDAYVAGMVNLTSLIVAIATDRDAITSFEGVRHRVDHPRGDTRDPLPRSQPRSK